MSNEKIDFFPREPFKIISEIGHAEYPDNLYLAHNRFFCKMKKELNKKENNGYVSSLYFGMCQYNKKENPAKHKEMLLSLNKKMELMLKSFFGCSGFDSFVYSPESRLMIGVGGDSPYNNVMLMTLHQTYGFPYIPATAIKGCLRNYCEKEKPKGFDIKKLLGSDDDGEVNSRGSLIFFDTFPSEYVLDFDCITPHNTEYFESKGQQFNDMQTSKVPIHFLCVTNKSSFEIHIACTDREEWEKNRNIIMKSLENALKEYGIGAKTAYGYGLAKI